MQCGGSKGACCVELRIYDPAGSHRHYVIGNSTGDESPATIQMSGGAVSVLRREVLTHWDAIALFKCFFAGEEFPAKYSLREVAL
jgi:hypothetical protein